MGSDCDWIQVFHVIMLLHLLREVVRKQIKNIKKTQDPLLTIISYISYFNLPSNKDPHEYKV